MRAEAITFGHRSRWSTRFFYHPDRGEVGKSYTWAAGLIDGVDRFEPSFFGISPREAIQMDPQQRILLEQVWHAFEDAGIPPSRFHGSDTGVYVGASSTDYSDLRLGDPGGRRLVFHDRERAEHSRQPHFLCLRPAWSEPCRRHRLLVGAGGASSRLRSDTRRSNFERHRRRREPAADALPVSWLLPGVDAVAPGPVLCVRRARRRLCSR